MTPYTYQQLDVILAQQLQSFVDAGKEQRVRVAPQAVRPLPRQVPIIAAVKAVSVRRSGAAPAAARGSQGTGGKGYSKTTRCATSSDCQYSSGTKLVRTSAQFSARAATARAVRAAVPPAAPAEAKHAGKRPSRGLPLPSPSLTSARLRGGSACGCVQHRPTLAEPHRLRAPGARQQSSGRFHGGAGPGCGARAVLPFALPSGHCGGRALAALWCCRPSGEGRRAGAPSARSLWCGAAGPHACVCVCGTGVVSTGGMRGRPPLPHVAVAVALGVASGLYVYRPIFQPPTHQEPQQSPPGPTTDAAPERRP